MEKITVLNVEICNINMNELLATYHEGFLMPLNVDVLMKLQKDKDLYDMLKEHEKDVCICIDSQVICIFSKLILGKRFIEKISGSDYFPRFCKENKKNLNIKIFLLGAKKGVAQLAKKNINKRVGREIIVDVYSPPFGFEKDETECRNIVKKINESGSTVLAVGLGAPKQEKWIFQYSSELTNIKLFMAIGATIDFEAGKITRAPNWVNSLGFEWLFRLLKEPKRLTKRYLIDDMPFFYFLLKQRLGLYQNPFET